MNTYGPLFEDPAFTLAFRMLQPPPERPASLLVLLHGVGGDETNLASLAAAAAPGTLVVLPRGPVALGPHAFGWFRVAFTGSGPVIDAQEAEASRRLLVEFVRQLQLRHGIDGAHTVVAGFSQGGILSASVALSEPENVAGFGILAGRILSELEPQVAAPSRSSGLRGYVAHGHSQGASFAIEDVELSGPGPNEVLVRVVATGVCHTDAVGRDLAVSPYPVVLGHEGAGVVEKVGANVTGVSPGDHVVMSFAHCGHCDHCLTGYPLSRSLHLRRGRIEHGRLLPSWKCLGCSRAIPRRRAGSMSLAGDRWAGELDGSFPESLALTTSLIPQGNGPPPVDTLLALPLGIPGQTPHCRY